MLSNLQYTCIVSNVIFPRHDGEDRNKPLGVGFLGQEQFGSEEVVRLMQIVCSPDPSLHPVETQGTVVLLKELERGCV
jgi:hypothetical protein